MNKLLSKFDKKQKLVKVSLILISALFIYVLGWASGSGWIPGVLGSVFSKNNQGLPVALNYAAIQDEYNILKLNYDGKLSASDLQDGLGEGLASATGDPYTEYFSPEQAKEFTNELNNTFTGIGAQLGYKDNNIVIIAPLPGSPAYNAGIKAGDQILSVNGKSVANMNLDQVVNSIRGAAGTKVTIVVLRNGQNISFTITRATINAPSVQYKVLNGNIGYIQIFDFSNDTSALALAAAQQLKAQNVKGIVLDLRDNPGGLVDAAINVSSLWLPSGKTVVVAKHNNQVVQTSTSNGDDILNGIPTVVLIDGNSASASEITASALRDNGEAYLMGQKSFGKGSVQEIDNLPGGAEIKVTVAHWFTPDGKTIDKIGITPDKVVAESSTDAQQGIDDQLNAAISYLENK